MKVVQNTVFDVQASKRLFYTYNTVVLLNIIIIIAVSVSTNIVKGSLVWIRMRHTTCKCRVRRSVEEILNMPEQFD